MGRVAKAIGYVRVSSGVSELSEDSQAARIRAYSAAMGFELLDLISEQASGATPLAKRRGGQWLLHRIARGDAKDIIALKLDRVFRDAADALHQTAQWDQKGVTLHLVDMGGQPLNTTSPFGRMFLTMTAAFAELERNMIVERTTAALAHLKTTGKVYARVPLGYQRVGDGMLVEDESEMQTVRLIQDMHTLGQNYSQIAAELNRMAIPTKMGGAWWPATVRYVVRNNLYEWAPSSVDASP